MGNLTTTEIELAGENHVQTWLSQNGYDNVIKEILFPQETEIRASGSLESIIVQVRTFLHPTRPFKLSEYETHKVMLRASRQKNVAYAAYVVVDENMNLVGDIIWERLG